VSLIINNILITDTSRFSQPIAEKRWSIGRAIAQAVFFNLFYETIGTAATTDLLCQPRVIMMMIVESRWNVDWQGKPMFSEKTCPSATFVHHKIPHDQTRV
jgi:hypothetical protein